jgi:hypothetical protein
MERGEGYHEGSGHQYGPHSLHAAQAVAKGNTDTQKFDGVKLTAGNELHESTGCKL